MFIPVILSFSHNSIALQNNPKTDTTFVYWENMTKNQRSDILNSKHIDKYAIEFYDGKLKIGDNNQTIELLNTLSLLSNKGNLSPFYFFLFNRICNEADGALSEMLGDYCQRIILDSPAYTISYFTEHKTLLKKYAEYLGYEMYFKSEGTSTIKYSYPIFKKLLSQKLKSKGQYNSVLTLLCSEIEKTMNKMN